ncbi:MAG: FkbM family methyltransferase, partial [Methanoculleus sp.]|nr:FkbM family methyltransferase [Methanoculleus sp.]
MYQKHAPGRGSGPGYPPLVTTYDGVAFRRMPEGADAVYVVGEYHIDDIRPEDIVLDIGANVGAFCIRAARRSRRVLAVEPVLTEALQENIRTNDANVTVVSGA